MRSIKKKASQPMQLLCLRDDQADASEIFYWMVQVIAYHCLNQQEANY